MGIKVSEESINEELAINERPIVLSSSSFGILRKQLVRNIGMERIGSFLFHFGWEMGIKDAEKAKDEGLSLEELIKKGPLLHIESGHIRGIVHDCDVKHDESGNVLSVFGRGVWKDSYEAIEHKKMLGISRKPVCHTLIGYSSGFMSTAFGEPLLAKEITCIGAGDAECRWIVRTEKEWAEEAQTDLPMYNETSIVEELEYTYDQLLEQKNIITRLADFQQKLTEEVLNGNTMQEIADIVYEIGRIPVVIVGLDFRTAIYSGLSEREHEELKLDLEQHLEKQEMPYLKSDKGNQLPSIKNKVIKTAVQERLITPVLVQKEVLGYCSFVYRGDREPHAEDYLFLNRCANAASIILLNEKTKFESFERMKGNFLEHILTGKFDAGEIIRRGQYTNVNLEEPYHITVVNYESPETSLEESFIFQEQLLETAFRYFHDNGQNILVGNHDGSLALLITEEKNERTSISVEIEKFHEFIKRKYPQAIFRFGISNTGRAIENAPNHWEEAKIALRFARKKEIVLFQSLGIIGVLINTQNTEGIKMIAHQELGAMYDTKDPKKAEQLKTLYIFLMNAGKLEQTMSDLALSMSGLRHRIDKIENILGKNLRDPNEGYQLLMILKCLIALGELTIE
ncbi:XylR N-terminal domain-containing protein [Planococcus shenhongbingii]|uniref:XylR N-terminal domain-containing protein n=1 Tax=Planococcus shenhongbingii TaxID=3058398 RepID=A0ABT8NEA7_9BACL|nr:XylR N-terminal domain-containing protein [Planococcus sp. N017]MDN7246237.1 XylR N-terminal domain-containing protein [Planococcus sp. N017]